MPRQNRVNPFGELVATSARGTLMGNRGCLHNDDQEVRRSYARKEWIFCVLHRRDEKGNDKQRTIMSPGKYTELFFLDEATALAAGHRPCGYCMQHRLDEFCRRWAEGNPDQVDGKAKATAKAIDAQLHEERLDAESRTKQLYSCWLSDVPNGCIILLNADETQLYLVAEYCLIPWSFAGYQTWIERPKRKKVLVLNPPSTMETLRAGFQPNIHPSILNCI